MELKEYSSPLWKKITTEMNSKFFTEEYKLRRVLERIPKSMTSLVFSEVTNFKNLINLY